MTAGRNTFLRLTMAALWAVAVCMLFPSRAMAFAPMCDQSASTVVAPLVAPPELSGEILPCALSLDELDFGRPIVRRDSPPGERSPLLVELPVSRYWVSTTVSVPRRVNGAESLDFAPVPGWERPGHARLVERPPC